ncbi:ABC transporter ATP-binding protein [Micromonospora sp. WMMD1120]|uniref:ATP-binding cassette domain-containing protein n=1 Tax=Micromonospora sp. WMMD1120 TaxID=3016106 RepID=UPI00241644DF|nr:ABC transporter ATP-binding protein [Micromonospora sp. WMMD1120]MDG4810788.1 ABC transporter ATP-binding protein [Micromonospora sp. WMMD1120]
MSSEPLLRIRGLTVSYPGVEREILTGVDLDAPAGATVAVLGPSGAGKSTLVVAISGLLPDGARVGGEIWFDGVALHRLDDGARRRLRGRHIATIPQDPAVALDPVLPIGVQVAEALLIHRMAGRAEAARRAVHLLRSAGLPDPEAVAVRYPHNLSGGMRQRALVACALAAEPRLVLADEPTSAVDAVSQAGVLDDLASVTTGTGRTLILVTHDIGLAIERADWGVVLDRGRTVEAGPIQRLASAPRHPVTRALVAAAPHSRTARLRPRAAPASPGAGARDQAEARPLLRLEQVNVVYRPTDRRTEPVRAVIDVDAHVRRGETLGVVGESGAGKSTLAALALRLVPPTTGRVLFDGTDLAGLRGSALRAFRRRAQLVFQDAYAALNPQMTAATAIAEPLRALRLANRTERRIRVREAADLVGLPTSTLDRRPRELSGGECQRVVLARALVLRPDLLICDEPASALDAAMQAQVLQLLVDVQAELDLGYLFISHDLAAVRQVADRVLVLRHGQVVEQGVAADVLERPAHPYTTALVMATPGCRPAPELPVHHVPTGGT